METVACNSGDDLRIRSWRGADSDDRSGRWIELWEVMMGSNGKEDRGRRKEKGERRIRRFGIGGHCKGKRQKAKKKKKKKSKPFHLS